MKENTKKIISDLINRFHRNKEVYKNPKYNETQLRREFLDTFFSALGWDVANKQGFAEQYKEVVHEDAIKISGATKAPDYSFRIGGVRKFFVEAKKPAVDIKYDIHPSYQLRRYAWSAKLPISILTDFEEFSIYDCRIKPNQNDNASVARIYYQTYDNYLKDLQFIYNTFSKEAILKGGFDKYISTSTKKRGTSEVDKEFLKEIEKWRDTLARNIALRNKALSIFELNFLVQLTIDRIIFLRIAEDRGVENYRTLYKLAEKKDTYRNLFHLFRIADDKYNSGIFDFQKDKISPNINIDDKVLKSILLHLYYPESPYEFSVLPADILGNIYEQFLGKTIRLTSSHQAKVEEKPEVRKAGGVYYTPKYIVDYIVKNTVGEMIKGKTPRQISKITICDPACGSGSFLIQAYQYLLDYHREFYQKDPKKYKDKIIQIGENSYQLTTQEKKRILLNNIYGVDIDPQAVEVTKLSLLLKVLEGENKETLGKTLQLFHERALPNLSNNIKCGNSLIGTDFYENADMSLFGNEKMRKINAFDWEKEFPQIFRHRDAENTEKNGFDVVIGNPPYRAELSDLQRKYLEVNFRLHNTDTACLFISLAKRLLKDKGINGFIVPKPFVYSSNWKIIREAILNGLIEIIDCGKVWKKVKLEQIIYFYQKNKRQKSYRSCIRKEQKIYYLGDINKETFKEFNFYLNGISPAELSTGEKVKNAGMFLNDFIFNQRGAVYQKYIIPEISEYKVLGGKQIARYYIREDIKGFIRRDLINDDKAYVKENSILVQRIVAHIQKPTDHIKITASLSKQIDSSKYIIVDTINQLQNRSKLSSEFIVAIINSKLISWYSYRFIFGKAIRTMQFDNPVTSRIPFPAIDLRKKREKQIHDTLVSLVDQMLSAQKQFHSAKIERDKKLYKQKIDILDRKIDKLVYELYGLTEEEIKIVENDNENI